MAWMMDTYSMNDGRHRHRRGHRQADRPGRLARPARGHRARRVHRRRAKPRDASAWTSHGARVAVQGFGNVGGVAAELFAEAGAQDRGGAGPRRHDLQREAASTCPRCSSMCARTGGVAGFAGRRADAPTTTSGACHCDILIPAALESQITAANAGQIKAQHGDRRRQRPDHARGRRHPARRAASWCVPDVICQRRRRDGELLRMGAGLLQLLLERGRDQRPPGAHHERRLRRRLAGGRRSTRSACAPPPSSWPASASCRRASCAACTPENCCPHAPPRCVGRWPCRPRSRLSRHLFGQSSPAQSGLEPQPSAPRGPSRLGAARRRSPCPTPSLGETLARRDRP